MSRRRSSWLRSARTGWSLPADGLARPPAPAGAARATRSAWAATAGPAQRGEAVVDLDEPLQEARQHALLALEHLALRVEEQLAPGQRQEAGAHLG